MLSEQESEELLLWLGNASYQDIADVYGYTRQTARNHILRIIKKLAEDVRYKELMPVIDALMTQRSKE